MHWYVSANRVACSVVYLQGRKYYAGHRVPMRLESQAKLESRCDVFKVWESM